MTDHVLMNLTDASICKMYLDSKPRHLHKLDITNAYCVMTNSLRDLVVNFDYCYLFLLLNEDLD